VYSAIIYYQSLSGNSWDEAKGANIVTEAEAKGWKEFIGIKVCVAMATITKYS
jgi:hypothetical protein